jgi:hypothetical protein
MITKPKKNGFPWQKFAGPSSDLDLDPEVVLNTRWEF